MTAYARHGRQASDRRSSARALRSPAIRRSTRSPLGNASGSPSARIATYSAVPRPDPGTASSAATVALTIRVAGVRGPSRHSATARAQRSGSCRRAPASRPRVPRRPASAASVSETTAQQSGAALDSQSRTADARRPASVVAPRAEICWPTMARTPARNHPTPQAFEFPDAGQRAAAAAGRRAGVPAMTAGIGAEIEQPPHPFDNRQQCAGIGKPHVDVERRARVVAGHRDDARLPVDVRSCADSDRRRRPRRPASRAREGTPGRAFQS